VTVLAIFLSGEKDVYIDVRPTLILSATTTQLNLYELASSNRNAATRNEKVHGEKEICQGIGLDMLLLLGALLEQSPGCVGSGRR
jgi:hypothetical protein